MAYEEEMESGESDTDAEEMVLAEGIVAAMQAGDVQAVKDGLKEFIKTCLDEYGPGAGGGGGKDLALIFGPAPKGK